MLPVTKVSDQFLPCWNVSSWQRHSIHLHKPLTNFTTGVLYASLNTHKDHLHSTNRSYLPWDQHFTGKYPQNKEALELQGPA